MSYDLPAIIRDIPDWETKTAAECREYLSTEVSVPITTEYTVAMLEDHFGEQATSLITGTLRAAAKLDARLEAAWIAMSVLGIQLATPERQEAIVKLAAAGQWPDDLRDAVLALGRRMETRWARLSDEDLPDADAFTAAYAAAELYERKQVATASLREWVAAAEAKINAGVSWSEIVGKTTE